MNAKSRARGIVSAVIMAARKTYQEKNQNDEHKNHAAKQISFHVVGGDADEIAAVIVGTDFHVGRQKCPVDLFGFLSTPSRTFWVCSPAPSG